MYLYKYFPKISNSTLTISFTFNFLRFVSFKVCGMIFRLKNVLEILEIVRDTPLIEIDAFSTKYFLSFLFFISS